MKKETLRLIALIMVLGRTFAHASPSGTPAATAAAVFFPELRLGSYFDADGLPQSLEGGFSAMLLFTKTPKKGKTEAQSILLALYAVGGYSWEPASFIARAGLEFGDPHTGSIDLGTVFKKKAEDEPYKFYLQWGTKMKLLETALGSTVLAMDIFVNYTFPRGSIDQSGETLLDCIQAGIILGCRLPGTTR